MVQLDLIVVIVIKKTHIYTQTHSQTQTHKERHRHTRTNMHIQYTHIKAKKYYKHQPQVTNCRSGYKKQGKQAQGLVRPDFDHRDRE